MASGDCSRRHFPFSGQTSVIVTGSDQPLGRMSYKKAFQEVVGNWNHPRYEDVLRALHRTGVETAIRIRPRLECFAPKASPLYLTSPRMANKVQRASILFAGPGDCEATGIICHFAASGQRGRPCEGKRSRCPRRQPSIAARRRNSRAFRRAGTPGALGGLWGPYLSERQWGTVREDYSENGDAWDYFTHDQARSRAYHWGEDGIAGFSDDKQRFALRSRCGMARIPYSRSVCSA